MAKPRIFISSTYYDLRHIRDNLENFIVRLGYEPVLYERGDIPFSHQKPLDESCYDEIKKCHMFILIVGGRYGSPDSTFVAQSNTKDDEFYKDYNSVTQREYLTAREKDIPIFIFVESKVYSEYETYKGNKDVKDFNPIQVDNINVYKLLDDILEQRRNNYIKDFSNFNDIENWLKSQWAGFFADYLSHKADMNTLKDMAAQISDLKALSTTLKEYSESIIRKVDPDKSKSIISEQEKWLQQEKLNTFKKDHMTMFFLTMTNNQAEDLYDLMQKNDNVYDLLKELGCSIIGIDTYSSKDRNYHFKITDYEYQEYRHRFL